MRKLSEAVIYQIMLRNFTDEGTLDKAAERLEHVAAAGMDYVYLSPVAQADADADRSHWSRRALDSGCDNERNPYRISDYFAVDEEYGGAAALKRFVKEAHRLGLGVLLDLVYYHCGPHCPLAREHAEYFRRLPDGSIDPGQFNMLVFDYAQPGLRRYMTDNMLFLLREYDVDGFRCDCGDWIPAAFWEDAVREARHIKPDLIMLNEGHEAGHLRQAFQVDYGVFLAEPLRALLLERTTDAAAIRRRLQECSARYVPGRWGVCGIENHDFANDAYDRRVEKVLPPGAMEAAAVLCFTLGGVPFVYNGFEMADARRHSIFHNSTHGTDMGIDWRCAATEKGRERYRLVQHLADMRHHCAALQQGRTAFREGCGESVIAFERAGADESVSVWVNLSEAACAFPAPEKAGETLLCREAGREGGTIRLGPFGYLISLVK